jgi:hypothetical protein
VIGLLLLRAAPLSQAVLGAWGRVAVPLAAAVAGTGH